MWQTIKQNWKRYLASSLITFLSFFLPALLLFVKETGFDGLMQSGAIGVIAVVIRLVGKAIYESVVVLLTKLVAYLKK